MAAPPPGNPPAAEVTVDTQLVERLLEAQHPDLARRPLHLAAEGWDNLTFRLGQDMAVRMPRRQASARLIENEQAWLPQFAPRLPIRIPSPVRVGVPGAGFNWHWSIVPWIEGDQALNAPLRPTEAGRLGEFLRALHDLPMPAAAPHNPYRGVALADRKSPISDRLSQLAAETEHRALARAASASFDVAADAVLASQRSWLHGDLHGKNILSDGGRIAAIIDWGDICAGDIATDLAALWIMFPTEAHGSFWDEYGEVSRATLHRAGGWAIVFGLMLWAAHHEADPVFAKAGLEAINRACEM